MSETTGREPLERDRNGDRILTHGLSGYARGCRCDACMERKGSHNITHGLNAQGVPSGYSQGCRCDLCKAGKREYMAARRGTGGSTRRGRVPAEDRHDDPRSVPLSARELKRVNQARGEMPLGRYMRMLVLEGAAADLGLDPDDLNTVGRQAPRRRNYSERQGR